MPLAVLSRREADIAAALVDAAVAPGGDLPAVRETSAIASLDETLRRSPALNRLGLRGLLFLVEVAPRRRWGGRLRRLPRPARADAVRTLERGPLGPAVRGLRSLAVLSYYGDDAVLRARGYDPEATLARARAARVARAGGAA